MSDALLIGLLTFFGTLVLALAGYLGNRWATKRQVEADVRKSSGDIKTSSADALWEAQDQFRKDLTAEVERLRTELIRTNDDCDKRLLAMENKLEGMKKKLRQAGEG